MSEKTETWQVNLRDAYSVSGARTMWYTVTSPEGKETTDPTPLLEAWRASEAERTRLETALRKASPWVLMASTATDTFHGFARNDSHKKGEPCAICDLRAEIDVLLHSSITKGEGSQ